MNPLKSLVTDYKRPVVNTYVLLEDNFGNTSDRPEEIEDLFYDIGRSLPPPFTYQRFNSYKAHTAVISINRFMPAIDVSLSWCDIIQPNKTSIQVSMVDNFIEDFGERLSEEVLTFLEYITTNGKKSI